MRPMCKQYGIIYAEKDGGIHTITVYSDQEAHSDWVDYSVGFKPPLEPEEAREWDHVFPSSDSIQDWLRHRHFAILDSLTSTDYQE